MTSTHISAAATAVSPSFLRIDRKIRIEAIAPALTARDWTLKSISTARWAHVVLIVAGRGHLVGPLGPVALAAPVLAWVPPGAAERLHLRAGAAGQLLAVAEDLLASTLGSGAESLALGHITDRLLTVAMADDSRLADLRHSFTAIGREIARPESGSWTSAAAHISLILVGLWRASGVEAMAGVARGTSSAVLQRFRSLVEMNFRDHWSIPRYADALAVSPDRLHAICLRDLKRPPLNLVHERVIREAMLLLDRSMLTVEQISDHLNFKDPAHFNRFFKTKTGTPPGTFRRAIARSAAQSDGLRSIYSFADWP